MKRISPVSKRRARQKREYARIRPIFLKENSYCARCSGRATEIHHKKGKIETLLTNELYFLPVCRSCHVWIELHPEEAKELGYSLNRL